MKSMTGFGQAELFDRDCGLTLRAEISTVNRKQLEIRISLPSEISIFEVFLRNLIATEISRGSVQFRVKAELNQPSKTTARINETQVMTYIKKIERLSDKLDFRERASLAEILNLPGSIDIIEPEYNFPEFEKLLKKVVKNALIQVLKMRKSEGHTIKTDCDKRIAVLVDITKNIKRHSKKIPGIQKDRLLKRLNEMKLQLSENDDRILREMVIFTDRSDVSEEIARLESHFDQFRKISENEEEPIGRSLDFLIQEMFREITTLGNKAAHANVTPLVVQFKTELEKIREQIQNIE